jgi:hypothetical protein
MIDPAAMGGFRVVAFASGSRSMPPLPESTADRIPIGPAPAREAPAGD